MAEPISSWTVFCRDHMTNALALAMCPISKKVKKLSDSSIKIVWDFTLPFFIMSWGMMWLGGFFLWLAYFKADFA